MWNIFLWRSHCRRIEKLLILSLACWASGLVRLTYQYILTCDRWWYISDHRNLVFVFSSPYQHQLIPHSILFHPMPSSSSLSFLIELNPNRVESNQIGPSIEFHFHHHSRNPLLPHPFHFAFHLSQYSINNNTLLFISHYNFWIQVLEWSY